MSNKKTYTSSGTIALVYDSCADKDHILFAPATHHTIQHGRRKFAVFVPDQPSESVPVGAKMLELTEGGTVKIEASDASRVIKRLGPAAFSNIGVDISVRIDGDNLRLRGAIIPSISHTK